MPGHFLLDKWYFDAIREDGSGIILYDARLRWKWLRINYYNRLEFNSDGSSKSVISFRRQLKMHEAPPEWIAEDAVLKGHWRASVKGFGEDLLNDQDGLIRWNCHCPNAEVTLSANHETKSARGYAEQLIMTLDPWKFNIDELYWGRFCSNTHSVVWIEWRGEIAKKWLFLNGSRLADFELTDDTLRCGGFEIDLTQKIIIRTGSLISTVFKSLRWLRYIFPGKTMFSDETKWHANAELKISGHVIRGYAIFEKVKWEK